MRSLSLVLLLLLGGVSRLPAQREAVPFPSFDLGPTRSDASTSIRRDPDIPPDPGITGLALAGLAGAVVGAAFGARVGGGCPELGCDDTFLIPLLLGESLGLSAAVHLAARSKQPLGNSILATTGIAAATWGAAALTGEEVMFLALPVLQLAAAIDIARE